MLSLCNTILNFWILKKAVNLKKDCVKQREYIFCQSWEWHGKETPCEMRHPTELAWGSGECILSFGHGSGPEFAVGVFRAECNNNNNKKLLPSGKMKEKILQDWPLKNWYIRCGNHPGGTQLDFWNLSPLSNRRHRGPESGNVGNKIWHTVLL